MSPLDFSGHKVCITCGENKYYLDFHSNKSFRDGVSSVCKPCHNLKVRKKYNPLKRKAYKLKYLYGITLEEYESKLKTQGYGCAICKTNVPGGKGKYFYVDHDHITGQVRDLLCHNCNFVVGYAKEDTDILRAAINYLEVWGDES